MALKYTGKADPFYLEEGGKAYHPGDTIPISKKRAAAMALGSNLHTFEDDGQDIVEAMTAPERAAAVAPAEAPKKS